MNYLRPEYLLQFQKKHSLFNKKIESVFETPISDLTCEYIANNNLSGHHWFNTQIPIATKETNEITDTSEFNNSTILPKKIEKLNFNNII